MRTAAVWTPCWPALTAHVAIRDGGAMSSWVGPHEADRQVITGRVFARERIRRAGCVRMDRWARRLADRSPVPRRSQIAGVV